MRETAPPAPFFRLLGQSHVNGWSRVIAFQNGGLTSYIFPFKLRVYNGVATYLIIGINKKTKIKKIPHFINFQLIYIDHRKITWLWS